jgi:prepilin-type N-terminal cleavage/methylation domain-containing protein
MVAAVNCGTVHMDRHVIRKGMFMNKRTVHFVQKGFTLVELLIVAIILAILAAIVVPQFASSTTDAQESALRSDLAGIRAAIDLYRQQHGAYPGVNASSGGTCTGGTKGTGAAGTATAFGDQLVRYTDRNGNSCSLQDASGELFPFGPYLKENQIPTNPITGDATIEIVTTGDLEMGATGAGGGWKYDTTSGKFIANDTNTDSAGNAYDTY